MSDRGLATMIADAGLARHAATILSLARPSIRIAPTPRRHDLLAPRASRFGGVPAVPVGFTWPSYDGKPMAFLGQLDLAALPAVEAHGLPRNGLLAFFYEVESMRWGFDPGDRGCAHVVWLDGDVSTFRTRVPPPYPDHIAQVFQACELSFTPTVDLPDTMDLAGEPLGELDDDQQERYRELAASLHPGKYHHVLGHPQLVQEDMRVECELASNGLMAGDGHASHDAFTPAARDWELLLQIDTDEDGPGWCWGDVGRIYFWIRRQDLAARRFDRSWLVLQCH